MTKRTFVECEVVEGWAVNYPQKDISDKGPQWSKFNGVLFIVSLRAKETRGGYPMVNGRPGHQHASTRKVAIKQVLFPTHEAAGLPLGTVARKRGCNCTLCFPTQQKATASQPSTQRAAVSALATA